MAVAGLALGAVAVGAGVFYLLESPTSPVPYATSRETPHEAGPLKGIMQGIPDILWPENKNPFARDGTYYEHKAQWEQYPQGQFGVDKVPPARAPAQGNPMYQQFAEAASSATVTPLANRQYVSAPTSAMSGASKLRSREYL